MLPNEEDGLYVAGHEAPPGRYVRIDVQNGRTIILERRDALPASLDGTVAAYRRIAELDHTPWLVSPAREPQPRRALGD